MLAIACDDNVSPIGPSLTFDSVEICIDSTYTLAGRTIDVSAIRPKTSQMLLGDIDIPAYGHLHSDIVTQFLPSTTLDTASFTWQNVDSVKMYLAFAAGNFTGDSIVPMGATAYRLNQLLPNNIASDFDPAGKYDPTPLGQSIYNASTLNDSLGALAAYRSVDFTLPLDLGRYMFRKFEESPSSFANGQVFARDVFEGVYVRSSYGSGRLAVISNSSIIFYMRSIKDVVDDDGKAKLDTIDGVHQYMLVTPEVLSNSNIKYTMAESLRQRIAQGENMLVAPTGTEMEIEFPTRSVLESYDKYNRNSTVLNNLTLTLKADSIPNGAGITPPPYLLMVLKKDRDSFFDKNKLPDKKTSFYATYDAATGSYAFSDMRNYLLAMLEKEEVTADDYTFSLVPVQINFEQLVNSGYSYTTEYTESEVLPYLVTPVMAHIPLDKAKIKLTFSRLQ